MEVEILVRPQLDRDAAARLFGYKPHPAGTVRDGDETVEVAGRVCYLSWERPNPTTATNEGYNANIVAKTHFSVMEHSTYTFGITGVSRALAMEAIRHRHLSPSMQSQRYVDESSGDFVVPVDIGEATELGLALKDVHHQLVSLYQDTVQKLEATGLPRKQARQAARSILPNGHTTSFMLTGNLRAWRDFLDRRLSWDAKGKPLPDLEIFVLAQWVLWRLHQEAPNSLPDIWSRYMEWLRLPPAVAPGAIIEPARAMAARWITDGA